MDKMKLDDKKEEKIELLVEKETKGDCYDTESERTWLRDISKYDLLTEQEEKECGKAIKEKEGLSILNANNQLDWQLLLVNLEKNPNTEEILNQLLKMYNGLEESSLEKERKILLKYQELFQRLKRPLTKEELKEYFQIRNEKKINPDNLLEEVKHFSNYMEAKYKLFHANLHLVVRPARRYAYTSEMDFMDLALEGSLGLMKTVENYNVDREDSFSVYAVMEIRQAISKYINENRTSLKLKENEYMEIKDFQDSVDRLEYITKKKYTAEELSKIFEIPYQEVVGNLYFNPNFNSLDEPVEEDEDTTMESILAGVEVDFEARIFEEELRSILDECFQYLKPQEELVMRFVTGLNEEKRVYDLYEVSKKLKKTRQSTDAIYARAIKKLKLIVERKEIAKQLIYYMK